MNRRKIIGFCSFNKSNEIDCFMVNPINNLKMYGYHEFSKKIYIVKSNDNYFNAEINLNDKLDVGIKDII